MLLVFLLGSAVVATGQAELGLQVFISHVMSRNIYLGFLLLTLPQVNADLASLAAMDRSGPELYALPREVHSFGKGHGAHVKVFALLLGVKHGLGLQQVNGFSFLGLGCSEWDARLGGCFQAELAAREIVLENVGLVDAQVFPDGGWLTQLEMLSSRGGWGGGVVAQGIGEGDVHPEGRMITFHFLGFQVSTTHS